MNPIDFESHKIESNDIASSEIKIQLDNYVVSANRINEEIIVDVEELDKLKGISVVEENKKNKPIIHIDLRFEHPLEGKYIKQKTINISQKGNSLYWDGEKIGFIEDNVEMLSLTYIAKKLGYKLDEEIYKNKGSWKKHVSDGSYSFSIKVDEEDDEYLATANWKNAPIYSKTLVMKPINKD